MIDLFFVLLAFAIAASLLWDALGYAVVLVKVLSRAPKPPTRVLPPVDWSVITQRPTLLRESTAAPENNATMAAQEQSAQPNLR
jgi:hypothetical protein